MDLGDVVRKFDLFEPFQEYLIPSGFIFALCDRYIPPSVTRLGTYSFVCSKSPDMGVL